MAARAISESTRDRTLAFMRANQVTFGTAILETGALPEGLLLRALSVQMSAPPASGRDLASVPPEVIRLVPAKLAERHSVIPFRKVGRALYLAMARPEDGQAAAEIEFLTGLDVIRHVAISARIATALERHYGIPAPARIRAIVSRLDGPPRPAQDRLWAPPHRVESLPAPPPPSGPPHAVPSARPLAICLVPDLPDPWSSLPDAPEMPDGGGLVMETAESDPSAGVVLPSPGLPREAPASRAEALPAVEASAVALPVRLGRMVRRDEIALAILDSLRAALPAAAFFFAGGGRATGWLARPEPPALFRESSILLSEPSIFSSPRTGAGLFASCPDTAANRRILAAAGIAFPAVVGILPVNVGSKEVYYLLGERTAGAGADPEPLFRKHAAMAEIALGILALRIRLAEVATA